MILFLYIWAYFCLPNFDCLSNPIILISFIDCTCLEVCVCVSTQAGREKSNNFCVNMTKDYVKVSPYHDKCMRCYCYKLSLMPYLT